MRLSDRGRLSLLLITVFLTGCGSLIGEHGVFRDKREDYVKTNESGSLNIPKTLNAREMVEYMNVPQIAASKAANSTFYKDRPPRAPQQLSGAHEEIYRLENSSDGVVLHAGQTLESVWTCVESYWEDLGVQLSLSNITAATMDTGWLIVPEKEEVKKSKHSAKLAGLLEGADSDRLQRFRLVFKRGSSMQQVSIFAKNANKDAQEQTDKQVINWDQISSEDSHLEGRLLNQLMIYLAQCSFGDRNIAVSNKDDTETNKIISQIKSSTVSGLTVPLLEVNLEFSQAWEKVLEAMVDAGMEVSDKDRSSGLFFVETDSISTLANEIDEESSSSEESLAPAYRLKLVAATDGKKTDVMLMSGAEPAPESVTSIVLEKLKNALEK